MPSSDSRSADVNHDTVGESPRSAAELAVRRYVPNSLRPDQWAAIADFTVDIALRLNPSHPKRAIESMRTLSQFIHWARTQGLPLDVELIFDPDTVEGYIAGGCPHLAASSRATRRAYLRSYGRQITTTAPWPPSIRPLRQDYAVVPYSDAEVAGCSKSPHRNALQPSAAICRRSSHSASVPASSPRSHGRSPPMI